MARPSPARATVSRSRHLIVERSPPGCRQKLRKSCLLEIPGRPSHRSEREPPGAVPGESTRERVSERSLVDPVHVSPGRRGEAGIEPVRCEPGTDDDHLGCEHRVQRLLEPSGRDRGPRPERGHLATRVDTRIRAPRHRELHRLPEHPFEVGNELALDRPDRGSRCIAQPRKAVPSYASESTMTDITSRGRPRAGRRGHGPTAPRAPRARSSPSGRRRPCAGRASGSSCTHPRRSSNRGPISWKSFATTSRSGMSRSTSRRAARSPRFANVISFSANGRSCFAFASVVRIPSCTKSWAASVDSRSFW